MQWVISTGNNETIDHVDHVIEMSPLEELQDILDNLPQQLSTLKMNPLHGSVSLKWPLVANKCSKLVQISLSSLAAASR